MSSFLFYEFRNIVEGRYELLQSPKAMNMSKYVIVCYLYVITTNLHANICSSYFKHMYLCDMVCFLLILSLTSVSHPHVLYWHDKVVFLILSRQMGLGY